MIPSSSPNKVVSSPTELRLAALFWLAENDPARKAAGVRLLAGAWLSGEIGLDTDAALTARQTAPGHPAKPELVAPRLVKRRSMITSEGRAILIHALVHIEFNAIKIVYNECNNSRN